jgi:hypothetical protein
VREGGKKGCSRGLTSGRGVLSYTNGDKFEIEYNHDEVVGKGVKTFACGDVLTCDEWKEDYLDSPQPRRGSMKLSNKDEIEGQQKCEELQSGAFYKTVSGTIFVMKTTSLMSDIDSL